MATAEGQEVALSSWSTDKDSLERVLKLESEIAALKSKLEEEERQGKNDENAGSSDSEKSELTLQSNIYNGFLLLYYHTSRWNAMRFQDRGRVIAWLIIAVITQLCSVGLLCGLLIHKSRHSSPPEEDISEKSLEVLAFLMPAVLGAGFIFVYDEVRRPLVEMANLHNHQDLTIVGWWNYAGMVKVWEILFGLFGSWAYFISLIYSTKNTLHGAQGFMDIILNMLAYVFVFGIDEWTFSMIAVREFVPQWSDDWFTLKATENTQVFFKMARNSIKILMLAVYILVLVLWFEEFYHSNL
ncbi:hypothetical protein RFI_04287 [Reticulomyxa filosa]|uniref:Uncharacterized protein n=1 Tax=Reticulomyxa filosa TaxID=46433 RepID=X6P3Q9_RETFI|nr:hypothetical protein RFI_04287 [Reticulomyxa filosa]|eukprot:ETO32831.1 hypothetical protein RFI_04287 [Reticulomyxa filosa]